MKVLHVVGARPNFMKVAPIMEEMARYPERFEQVLVHTGQHYDDKMSAVFFRELEIPEPDYNRWVSILTDDGVFAGMYRLAWAVIRKRVSVERLRQEMQAQADVLLDAGLTVGHIDSHWHMHHLPVISEAVVQVAQRVGAGAVRVSREPLAFAPAMLKPTAKKALMLPLRIWQLMIIPNRWKLSFPDWGSKGKDMPAMRPVLMRRKRLLLILSLISGLLMCW